MIKEKKKYEWHRVIIRENESSKSSSNSEQSCLG